MNLMSRVELNSLLKESEFPCISLYMPTHTAGSDNRQDPIRYKNLLRDCRETLKQHGVRSREADGLLDKPRRLMDEASFWRHQSGGLAVFVSPGTFGVYRLPLRTEELLTVSGRFHVKPLLPLFSRDGLFYVLALSQKHVRLLQCSRYSSREVEMPDVPASIDEMMAGMTFDRAHQFHTGTPSPPGSDRAAVFHTQGGGGEDSVKKKYVLEFFRLVRDGVHKRLADRDEPLVLAGVEFDRASYHELDKYPHTLSEGIGGNPDLLSGDELCRRGWEVVEPVFSRQESDAVAAYEQLEHTTRAARDVRKVAPAAYEGRIQTLLVSLDDHVWGTYVPEHDHVEVHDTRQAGDEDLLDFAAAHALKHGGNVHALGGDAMPGGASAAAVLRF